jgi:hypothetical protein
MLHTYRIKIHEKGFLSSVIHVSCPDLLTDQELQARFDAHYAAVLEDPRFIELRSRLWKKVVVADENFQILTPEEIVEWAELTAPLRRLPDGFSAVPVEASATMPGGLTKFFGNGVPRTEWDVIYEVER